MNIAYNAALQLATAALAAAGYRAAREKKHRQVIQSLAYTIQLDRDSIDLFDTFRRKRNVSDYERTGTVSDRDAEDMIRLAGELRSRLINWLKQNHPKLIP